MSQVAVASPATNGPLEPSQPAEDAIEALAGQNAPLRPSPWHQIAHSLSEAPSPMATPAGRRSSRRSPQIGASVQPSPHQTPPVAALSTSQALRNWEALLAEPTSEAKRHHLVNVPSDSCRATPTGIVPKLAAERDKSGHIEYKLKLIDPTPERFHRLVTQMAWRLKQGRGEAIYEIGLADDGTVIGLTRPEMEASLLTLEQMAAELDGTVIILKEIVLYGSVSNLPSPAPALSSSVSSAASSVDAAPSEVWTIRRPDLDDTGRPRRGSRGVSDPKAGDGIYMTKRQRARAKWVAAPTEYVSGERKVIFDAADLVRNQADGSDDEDSPGLSRTESRISVDDDIPPFHLDLEDSPAAALTRRRRSSGSAPSSVRSETVKANMTQPSLPGQPGRKSRDKAERAAARREKRRLDLFKGDGTNPDWTELAVAAGEEMGLLLPTIPEVSDVGAIQPASTLRIQSAGPPSDDGTLIDEVLHLPIDNLSLSFAEVRTVNDPNPYSIARSTCSSPSTQTELACSPGSVCLASTIEAVNPPRLGAGTRYFPPAPGEEFICVEALVVRKSRGVGRFPTSDDLAVESDEEDSWDFSG